MNFLYSNPFVLGKDIPEELRTEQGYRLEDFFFAEWLRKAIAPTLY